MKGLKQILASSNELQQHGHGTLTCIKHEDVLLHQSTVFIHIPRKNENELDFLMRVADTMRDGNTLELVVKNYTLLHARVLSMPRA